MLGTYGDQLRQLEGSGVLTVDGIRSSPFMPVHLIGS